MQRVVSVPGAPPEGLAALREPAVQARRAPASPLQPQPGTVVMLALRTPMHALLLPLVAGSTMLVHSGADPRRAVASTVVVGRVTSGGVPVAAARVSIVGRNEAVASGADGS